MDLRAAADAARRLSRDIDGILPVGKAWNRAFQAGFADSNPYDGVGYGQVDLWTYDNYHASIYGYYLESLVVFGHIAGVDPITRGPKERATDDLGISKEQAARLQQIASEQLKVEPVGASR